MTAKELAEKLLEYPDYEVFISCDSAYEAFDDAEDCMETWEDSKEIYIGY